MGRIAAAGRRAWPSILAMILGGCGADPKTGRIDAGAAGYAYAESRGPVPVQFAGEVVKIPTHTRIKILTDNEPDDADIHRKVVVAIDEGEHKGMAGQMERGDVRVQE